MCFFYGALLSDAYAEKHGNGVRVTFHHSTRQSAFRREAHVLDANFLGHTRILHKRNTENDKNGWKKWQDLL